MATDGTIYVTAGPLYVRTPLWSADDTEPPGEGPTLQTLG
jgi:hypothetical protein